ncbi:MAG: cytochrome c oxidase subunit II [Acidimicrobiia bacterium]
MDRRDLPDRPRRAGRWLALALPLVLLVAGCASDAPLDTLDPKGPAARKIDQLVDPVFLVAGVVFLFVQFGCLFLAWKFRRRQGDDELPEQVHGNFRLEIGWTILPTVVLAFVGFFTMVTILDLSDKEASAFEANDLAEGEVIRYVDDPAGALEVDVIGNQWWWEYRYDVDGDGVADIVTANDLVIPAGYPVNLSITSRDVIHSFWIPNLNGKKDAVPGRVHELTLEADEPGVFAGQCTEFCGLSHAYMRMRAVALSPADFDAWVDNQMEPAEDPEEGTLAATGQELFNATCSRCHLVSGGNDDLYPGEAEQVSGAAPNLTHFASRGVFAGAIYELWEDQDGNGVVDVDEIGGKLNVADLAAWLRDPPAEKPMFAPTRGMPNLDLTPEAIEALIAYLETLD